MLSKRSGEMGEVARGYNHSMQGGGAQQNLGDTWSVVKVPRLPPDFFYGLRPGAMIHYAGGLLGAITAYAPNYWEIETCEQRQRPNPYEAWRLGGDPRHANPWVR